MAKREIKLCDGFRVIHAEGVELVEDFKSIFTDLFEWNLNEELAKSCYDAIFREVFCFGRCDLSKVYNTTLIIETIPVSE